MVAGVWMCVLGPMGGLCCVACCIAFAIVWCQRGHTATGTQVWIGLYDYFQNDDDDAGESRDNTNLGKWQSGLTTE